VFEAAVSTSIISYHHISTPQTTTYHNIGFALHILRVFIQLFKFLVILLDKNHGDKGSIKMKSESKSQIQNQIRIQIQLTTFFALFAPNFAASPSVVPTVVMDAERVDDEESPLFTTGVVSPLPVELVVADEGTFRVFQFLLLFTLKPLLDNSSNSLLRSSSMLCASSAASGGLGVVEVVEEVEVVVEEVAEEVEVCPLGVAGVL
jgi:hypothetical protein